jgi:phospholipase C
VPASPTEHIVVVMMSGRSFDHMLGGLRRVDSRIDGLTGAEQNPDFEGRAVRVQSLAQYQGQLNPSPASDFASVDQQLFDGDSGGDRTPTNSGFVKNYYAQRQDARDARRVMYYFKPKKLPVLTTLATEFAVFDRWFASVPGPSLCNRAFAHYGTSFGHVGMELFYDNQKFKSIYDRLLDKGKLAKLYYFDQASSALEVANLLQKQPQLFGTYAQFLNDCKSGTLPDYAFVEPNFTDHDGPGGNLIASDQNPDHHVAEGEQFIATIYEAIRRNDSLWKTTALLITYDTHGGLYDHVPPPPCTPDEFVAQPEATKTSGAFHFDRLGVRVPAILVSPWIAKGTVVNDVFEHSSIPATITARFLGEDKDRSPREKSARTFLDVISLTAPRSDVPEFSLDELGHEEDLEIRLVDAGFHAELTDGPDFLDIGDDVEGFARLIASSSTSPPLSIGLFGAWGSGKSFFMAQLERRIAEVEGAPGYCKVIVPIRFNAWHYADDNLWATLVTEIFSKLFARLSPDSQASQRQQLETELFAAKGLFQVSKEALSTAEQDRKAAEQALIDVQNLREDKEREFRQQFDDVAAIVADDKGLQHAAREVKMTLGLDKAMQSYEELALKVNGLHSLWNRVAAIAIASVRGPGLWVALIAIVLAPAIGWWLLEWFRHRQWSDVQAKVAALTAAMTWAATVLGGWLKHAAALVGRVETAFAKLRERREERIKQSETKPRAEIEALRQRELAARDRVTEAESRVAQVTREIDDLAPDRRMYRFIQERSQTTDYRQHLGLVSLVRQDFARLSELLGRPAMPVNRIVLFIDDLDRCDPDRVVKVLEAVHLLLAVRLFVVVVGVDARWVSRSLVNRYQTLLSETPNRDAGPRAQPASPDDYLEKIFQVPFWIRPIDTKGTTSMLRGLLPANREAIAHDAPPPSADAHASPPGTDAERESSAGRPETPKGSQDRDSSAPPGSVGEQSTETPSADPPEPLVISNAELEFIDRLAPYVGPSPRRVKRFVNVYRLLRASMSPSRTQAFLRADGGGDYTAALTLLAIATGAPTLSGSVFKAVVAAKQSASVANILADAKKLSGDEEERSCVAGALSVYGEKREGRTIDALKACVEQISRYSFHPITSANPPASPASRR